MVTAFPSLWTSHLYISEHTPNLQLRPSPALPWALKDHGLLLALKMHIVGFYNVFQVFWCVFFFYFLDRERRKTCKLYVA